MDNTKSLETHRFRTEVLAGLKKPRKQLPSKYFYDEWGSELFDRITDLDEYYVSRAETELMQMHIDEISHSIGENALLIEYGSGSSTKTRILLSNIRNLAGYVPIDISREYLLKTADNIREEYPVLDVYPLVADYSSMFEIPYIDADVDKRVVYFPGSSIGNFDPIPAQQFLERVAHICGPHGTLLIGIDLKKEATTLHRAYNDSEGVTAAFNINLLTRINRELGANFDIDAFEHYAFYNPDKGRVEMHLISSCHQTVTIGNTSILFRKGESIWTENSYKYNVDEFGELASMAGFSLDHAWYDSQERFALLCCTRESY